MKRNPSFQTRDHTNTQVCRYRLVHFLGGECVCIFMDFGGIEPFVHFLEIPSHRGEFQRPVSLLRKYISI